MNEFNNSAFKEKDNNGISATPCLKLIYQIIVSPKIKSPDNYPKFEKQEYGIAALKENTEICRIDYISADLRKVSLLADKLNKYEVSIYHFKDVVRDFISQY